MIVQYDLSKAPPTYDFLSFLALAEMERLHLDDRNLHINLVPGPAHGFRDDNLPPTVSVRQQMLHNVVIPAAQLVGATIGWGRGGREMPYMLQPAVSAAKDGWEPPVFQPNNEARRLVQEWSREGKQDRRPLVVVTLRESSYHDGRNSSAEWCEWLYSASIRAPYRTVVVRDTHECLNPFPARVETASWASVDLHMRAALYETADLNIAVNNGPCHLMYFNPNCNYRVFKQIVEGNVATDAEWWREKIGLEVGEQYPWATDNQRLMWRDDTRENIETAVDEWWQSYEPICGPQPEPALPGHPVAFAST